MLAEESDHFDCLRLPPVYLGGDVTQPRLRVARLLQILRERVDFAGASSGVPIQDTEKSQNSRKRGRDAAPDKGKRKRTKVSLDDAISISDSDEGRSFHAYRRVFRIRYTTSTRGEKCADEGELKTLGWAEDEKTLREWLASYVSAQPNQCTIDLGLVSVLVEPFDSGKTYVNTLNGLFLLAFSTPRSPFALDEYDFHQRPGSNKSLREPLQAFGVLENSGRASIKSHLFLDVTYSEDPEELPFTLRLHVDCSFHCPQIFERLVSSSKAEAARNAEVQDAQRRLVLHLFPPQSPAPASYRGNTDIPYLFSILQPAPPLPSPQANDALQPESLLPTLLPFQRRSVGWMLNREGKAITATGEIVAQSELAIEDRPVPIFWERFPVSTEETWYINRLRGLISPTWPKGNDDEDDADSDAMGGIVAEEPGLGKTLECISTITLNPAVGRSPANKHWDGETKLDVKEVKTTLIVTPPSLAPQWADELATHAPDLKVLIYEGWQKVPVPITERHAIMEREKRRAAAQAKKEKARAKSARARGRGKSKGIGQAEVEDDMDLDDEGEEVEVMDWCAYVNTFDVCITTYSVLQQDLGVARPPPVRPRRAFVQYSTANRPRSPLIMCEWYRVIMDEVQMVGGGKTEEMVSLLPRLASFAVSGTPARHQVADLIHVLKFLRVNAVTNVPRAWTRLQLPGYVHEFTELFRRYTVRTMKVTVKDELTIPPQTRYLVPIEFGPVQRHVYDQTLDAALLDLGLDIRGVAATENWEVDVAKLRYWLRRLRELCTHPQIGQLLTHGKSDKLHQPGVLKSMTEVLEAMREQNWRNYMEDRNERINQITAKAQLVQQNSENKNRYRDTLELLLAAEKEADKLIAEILNVASAHAKEGERLRAEVRAARRQSSTGPSNDRGKGKEKAKEAEESRDEDQVPEHGADEDGIPRNAMGEAYKGKLIAINSRLREARIAMHKVKFLLGDVYHILGAMYEQQENDAYAAAEDMRRVLLKSTEEAAQKAMTYLDKDPEVAQLKEQDLHVKTPYLGKGGIRSAGLMEEANELLDGLLRSQSALLWKWRRKLIELLTQPLASRGSDDADGQEYSRSLETQGEAEAYLQAYASLLADRREVLTAERTLLAAHDVREVKARKTKAARKAKALANSYETLELEEEVVEKLDEAEIMPEHEVLLKDLHDERKTLLEEYGPERAVKSIMVDLNNVVLRCGQNEVEKVICQEAVAQLRHLIAAQGKLNERLQGDLGHLRKAFNERIAYFRQLQEISDTVAEVEWQGDLTEAIQAKDGILRELETRINTARARQRYMDNLSKSHEQGTVDEDDKTCILCKCDFIRGYITPCAHVYCEDCMKAWVARPEGKACPVCRVPIHASQLQRFTIDNRPDEPAQAPPKILDNNEVMPRSYRQIQYNYIDPQTLKDIQAIDIMGSFGSKIETLVKHLLYLQITEPDAKSIVFSAWADSLFIIQHALRRNGIPCLRIDQNSGKQNAAKKFRTDSTIRVLLLHGERENAGLNVTCASRVFLVESVVHHAFEVQAIARIDRMGQTRPTEVYCYYAEETVERNILDLAAKQGLSLYTRENAVGALNVTPFAAESTRKQVDAPAKKVLKGDFVFKTDDMLAIFFPHMFEDVEYLIPPEASQTAQTTQTLQSAPRSSRQVQENAVAGPSRLH